MGGKGPEKKTNRNRKHCSSRTKGGDNAKVFPHHFCSRLGWSADIVRDFGAADERDPYVGWNTGRRYNDPDGWVKFRNTELNFEGLVLRLVKDFGYYDASNDEELADFKTTWG